VLPSSCSAISYIHTASARDIGFLDEVTEDELMSELMEGLPGFLETEGVDCKASEQGTPCYEDVTWLQTKGFEKHPEWYPGYSSRSSFQEVQDMLYRLGKAECPKPCLSKVLDADLEAESKHFVLSSGCADAVEGDVCYRTVRWLKRTGLEQHPDWFSNLGAGSSAAAIQAELHSQRKAQCPRPCSAAEGPSAYHAMGATGSRRKAGRVGSQEAAEWMWDFPVEEVAPTTNAGRAVMECLRMLLHVTPENFDDLRANCESLVPEEGAVQHDALVKESVKFIAWAQHHADNLRAKRKEQENADQDHASTTEEVVDPAAQPEVGEDGCLTAQSHTVCYTAVIYGLSEGIRKHPTMYEGLSERSSFERVQDFLWRNHRHGCSKPCPKGQVDILQFEKHPELLTYKKRVADMNVDELTRYMNNEWDGYVAKTFDNSEDESLSTVDTEPAADLETHENKSDLETHEDKSDLETQEDKTVQDMSKDELAKFLDGDMSSYMPKAATDTEPESANATEEPANASTENDSTPLFADIASINMSQMSEPASATEPDTGTVPEASSNDAVTDAPAEPVADAPTEAASATEPDTDTVPEASSNDAVADAPAESVADAPTQPVADAPREEME